MREGNDELSPLQGVVLCSFSGERAQQSIRTTPNDLARARRRPGGVVPSSSSLGAGSRPPPKLSTYLLHQITDRLQDLRALGLSLLQIPQALRQRLVAVGRAVASGGAQISVHGVLGEVGEEGKEGAGVRGGGEDEEEGGNEGGGKEGE